MRRSKEWINKRKIILLFWEKLVSTRGYGICFGASGFGWRDACPPNGTFLKMWRPLKLRRVQFWLEASDSSILGFLSCWGLEGSIIDVCTPQKTKVSLHLLSVALNTVKNFNTFQTVCSFGECVWLTVAFLVLFIKRFLLHFHHISIPLQWILWRFRNCLFHRTHCVSSLHLVGKFKQEALIFSFLFEKSTTKEPQIDSKELSTGKTPPFKDFLI